MYNFSFLFRSASSSIQILWYLLRSFFWLVYYWTGLFPHLVNDINYFWITALRKIRCSRWNMNNFKFIPMNLYHVKKKYKVILNISRNSCAAENPKSSKNKEQRIISYLYLHVRAENKNKQILEYGEILFISII